MSALRIVRATSRTYALIYKSSANCILDRTASLRLIEQNLRCLTSKKDEVFKKEMPRDNGNDDPDKKVPKYRGKTEDYKQKIYLKDVSGRMLGLKTREEAQLIAKHNRLILIKDDQTKKIPTLKLANPLEVSDEADSSPSSSETSDSESSSLSDGEPKSTARHQAPKRMMFSSKLSEHDFQVKIRHVKKWVVKGQETMIKVMARGEGDIAKLVSLKLVV